MLVIRDFNNKIIAKGETHKELVANLNQLTRNRTRNVKNFRVKGNIATWEADGRCCWHEHRGFVEPETHTPEQVQAILDDVEFEGWTFTFEVTSSTETQLDQRGGCLIAIPPAESGVAASRVGLSLRSSKRQIVQAAHELIRETLFESVVAPVLASWHERYAVNFRYQGLSLFKSRRDLKLLNEVLGPPVPVWRYESEITRRVESYTFRSRHIRL